MSVYIYIATFHAYVRVSCPELIIEHRLVPVQDRVVTFKGVSGDIW
jgi:hypothetical protein